MAGRSSTALYYYLALILHLVLLTECNYGVRYGDRAKRLHVAEYSDPRYRKPLIIDRRSAVSRGQDDGDGETSFGRTRRDAPLPEHPNNPNITTKVRGRRTSLNRSIVRRSPPSIVGRCVAGRIATQRGGSLFFYDDDDDLFSTVCRVADKSDRRKRRYDFRHSRKQTRRTDTSYVHACTHMRARAHHARTHPPSLLLLLCWLLRVVLRNFSQWTVRRERQRERGGRGGAHRGLCARRANKPGQ